MPNEIILARAGEVQPLILVTVLAGAVVVAASVFTVVLSLTGVIVVGIIDIVVSLLMFLAFRAVLPAISAVNGVNRDWSTGLGQSLGLGIAMLTGLIFLAAGLAGRARRSAAPGAVSRAASVAIALVGVGVGLPLAIGGGYGIYTQQYLRLSSDPAPVPILLVIVGAVLVGAGVYASALSSAGTLLMGAVVSVLGVVGLIAPNLLAVPLRGIDRSVASGFQLASSNGNLAMIGLVILAAGVGVALRARSARASV